MENPTQNIIEKIALRDSPSGPGDKEGGPTPSIVRPSSLNYKISLIEAVRNFINKEKLGPEQQIDVEVEEPVSKKMQNFAILDDALFNLNYVMPKTIKEKASLSSAQNQFGKGKRESSHRLENQWEREEEQIRKKLERNSIAQMKNKIAQ